MNAEILIGQLSYKQRSDIYNYQHEYEQIHKRMPVCESEAKLTDEYDSETETDPERVREDSIAHYNFIIVYTVLLY